MGSRGACTHDMKSGQHRQTQAELQIAGGALAGATSSFGFLTACRFLQQLQDRISSTITKTVATRWQVQLAPSRSTGSKKVQYTADRQVGQGRAMGTGRMTTRSWVIKHG